MALVHTRPELLREQLLARRRPPDFVKETFSIGGILPSVAACGRISRTTISGCPYATCRYVETTGDTGVLDENISFLQRTPDQGRGRSLLRFARQIVRIQHTLYEHGVRAIKNGLKFGAHNLPLMGCGDWNDGMNLVGKDGKGESVWLAFFLHDVLKHFPALRGKTR